MNDTRADKYWRNPLLGHIPILSYIFSRRQTDGKQVNLLIFITPKIIEKVPAVRQFQKESGNRINKAYRYGLIPDREPYVRKIYRAAKKDFEKKNYDAAHREFLEVLNFNPRHSGAQKYLEKVDNIEPAK